MEVKLTQQQRILVAALYFGILISIYNAIGGGFDAVLGEKTSDSIVWFFSGALMIVMGSYIVEPLFTKPSDAVANSVAVLVALLGISNKGEFFWFKGIFYYAVVVFGVAILCIALKDFKTPWVNKLSKLTYWFAATFGSSKWMFSVIYLSASYSYFKTNLLSFVIVVAFWIVISFFDVIGWAVKKISQLIGFLNNKIGRELGTAIGCENPFLYRVEMNSIQASRDGAIDYGHLVAVETSQNIGSIGMVINKKHLVNKKWLSVYLFRDENGDPIRFDLKSLKLITDSKTVFASSNSVYKIDIKSLSENLRAQISENLLYMRRGDFIGYIASGSNINAINFTLVREEEPNPPKEDDGFERQIHEGSVLVTNIYGKETLYQVIDGNTKEEHLENFDTHGYVVGIGRKLGTYDTSKRTLEVSKWVPPIYSPVFYAPDSGIKNQTRRREMARTSIGHLPDTDLEIPIKDIHSIVTHNTAILGILGIGKSCLSYELIKRVSEAGIKIVCIDITNEYNKELPPYVPAGGKIIPDNENAFDEINAKHEYIHTEGVGQNQKENPEKSGNVADYKAAVHKDLCRFLFGADEMPTNREFEPTAKVRIYNVDYHKASKGEKIGYKVLTSGLTQAEKTRIIAEELFKILMKIPLADEKRAKVLLVFEEAHSLIPEWGSVATDGDRVAVNGTAKVILQGRKYGLGSLVITQRTANVSKSILNQCNTIFALRVFDDTGKGFLSNYIGEGYANTLPTLEERHAIAIGKGLRLKQPVILRLNEVSDLLTETSSETPAEKEPAKEGNLHEEEGASNGSSV